MEHDSLCLNNLLGDWGLKGECLSHRHEPVTWNYEKMKQDSLRLSNLLGDWRLEGWRIPFVEIQKQPCADCTYSICGFCQSRTSLPPYMVLDSDLLGPNFNFKKYGRWKVGFMSPKRRYLSSGHILSLRIRPLETVEKKKKETEGISLNSSLYTVNTVQYVYNYDLRYLKAFGRVCQYSKNVGPHYFKGTQAWDNFDFFFDLNQILIGPW
jgi:hypothetical protein